MISAIPQLVVPDRPACRCRLVAPSFPAPPASMANLPPCPVLHFPQSPRNYVPPCPVPVIQSSRLEFCVVLTLSCKRLTPGNVLPSGSQINAGTSWAFRHREVLLHVNLPERVPAVNAIRNLQRPSFSVPAPHRLCYLGPTTHHGAGFRYRDLRSRTSSSSSFSSCHRPRPAACALLSRAPRIDACLALIPTKPPTPRHHRNHDSQRP